MGVILLLGSLFSTSLLVSGFVLLPSEQFLEIPLGLPCEYQIKTDTTQYSFHDPILIDENADFASQAAAEGWPGSGTETTPYIISGLNITGPINKQLISIKNTRVYFTISNCLLTGGRQGIALVNVRHGYLAHNILSNNDWDGVHLSGSRENYLVNNSIFNNRLRGIWFTGDSGNNSLIANKIDKGGLFIYADTLMGCVQALVANNTIDGKPLVYWQNQTAGTVPDNAGQVIIVNCTTITITGQNISDVRANMLVAFSSRVNIQQNVLSDGKYGIYLLRSKNCSLSSNIISRNRFGVFLEDSGSNFIVNNTIHDGDTGIQCYGGNNIFLNNSIIANSRRGINVYYSGPNLNTIMFNDFIDNGAREDGRNNSIYAYNYWSGLTSPDNNSDGIVDNPYIIENSMYGLPGTKDLYPQTTPNNPVLIHYISKPKILFPLSRAILLGTVSITVEWRAIIDFWGHDISYSVSYSPDSGSTWIEFASGLTSTSMEWNTTSLSGSTYYRLRVVATCSEGFTSEDTVDLIRPDHELVPHRALEYTVSPCYDCEKLPDWEDGEITVSVKDRSILFDQILIIWCNFDEQNFILELEQSGSNLTIIERYYATCLTDCLCPVRITGNISNLPEDLYNLIFTLKMTFYDLFDPSHVTRQNKTLAVMAIEIFSTSLLSEEQYFSPSVTLTSTTTTVSQQTPSLALLPLIVITFALTSWYKRRNS